MTVSKFLPLSEITLRKYEKIKDTSNRDLVKIMCLSLGLINPGDSRDVIVDIFQVLLIAKQSNKQLISDDIRKLVIDNRKNHNLSLDGTASSNIRRQLKRLKDLFIIEKQLNAYRIIEFMDLNEIITTKIEKYLLNLTLDRVKEYAKEIDSRKF